MTASWACWLTFGEPVSTRLAVPRETPARAATLSSVGARPGFAASRPLRSLTSVTRTSVDHVPGTPAAGRRAGWPADLG